MAKKKKKSKEKSINMGDRLSFLSNQEARDLLKRHEKTIFYLCGRISFLPGIGPQDLAQECRIRLVAGYHKFNPKKASERTWATAIIRKTLFGVWKSAVQQIRSCHIFNQEGEFVPVFNYPIDNPQETEEGESFSILDTYAGSPDERPVFGTQTPRQDEVVFLLNILEFLKSRLPPATYKYIRSKISPPEILKEIRALERRFRSELGAEGFSRIKVKKEYDIWFQLTDVPLKELTMLSQAAEVLIGELGFSEQDILSREYMIDANL